MEIGIEDVVTTGDRILDRPLHRIGTKGMFTKELDEALLDGRIDAAVHSFKDLPSELPPGVCVAAVPEREDPFDCLLATAPVSLDALPARARIGTSSLRRRAQLLARRPDLEVVEMRGNLETRWRKLEQGQCEALVLAVAGVRRLGWQDRIREVLDPGTCIPSPCQGALCVTARADDERVRALLAELDDEQARVETVCERAFLVELGGGCSVPAAGLARLAPDGVLRFRGLVASVDGRRTVCENGDGPPAEAERIGRETARRVLAAGGAAVLAEIER